MRSWHPKRRAEVPARSHWSWWAALWAVPILMVPVADRYLPPDIHLAHLLVIPLAVATAVADIRRTAVTAVLAVTALVVAGAERSALTTENVLIQLLALGLLSVLLVVVAHLRERNQRELAGVRRVSDAAQAALLRPLPRRSGPVSIASAYRAAETGARIGGDLYALVRTAHATRLIIGDARGKGLGAVGDTTTVLGAFRSDAWRRSSLSELATALEHSVHWGLAADPLADPADWPGEHFVTAAVLEIPDDEPCARLVSFGHLPPLLLRDGTVVPVEVQDPAPPLGLGLLSRATLTPMTFPFAPGDRLLLYTDGVTEARNAHGVFYPLVERVGAWTDLRLDALVHRIGEDLQGYTDGLLADDMAVIALQREQ